MTVAEEPVTNAIYEEAERLVRLGVSVIPIQPGTKEPPAGFRWGAYTGRLADASERYAWFVERDYQLAAVVDAVSGGLIVLDFDSPDGYERHAARYPQTRNYPRVKTARGHHVWVRSEQLTKKYTVQDEGRNLEVRSGRHYVLVPPSVHPSGDTYSWEVTPWDGIPAVDLETIGLRYVQETAEEPGEPVSVGGKPLSERDIEHIVDAVSPYYREGQRNPLVMALAGWMAYHDVPESDVITIADELRAYAPGPDDTRKLRSVIQRTYRQVSEGIAVKGWSALTDAHAPLISPGAAKRLDLLLRYRDPKMTFNAPQSESEAPSSPFSLIPFTALGSMPDPKQLIRGFLQAGTVAVVYGDGGSYKSFLALDLSLHVVNGEEWCGRAAEQAQVIYIAAEGAAGMKKRVKAWEVAHELPSDGAWLFPDSLQLTEPDRIESFIEAVQGQEIQPGLIVIDTLSQNSFGADENSSNEMAAVIGSAQRLASAFNAVVLIVHHSNKLQGFRGSTAIRDNVQTFMSMSREESGDMATLRCHKQRDLEPFDPMTFVPQSIVVKPGSGLMPPETSLVLELAEEAARVKRALSPETILTTLRKLGWSSYEDLMRELDVSKRQLQRALPDMLERRSIKAKETKSGRARRRVFAAIEEPDDAPDF